MTIQFTDDFSTTLAGAILNTDTQFQVSSGAGAGAPALDGTGGYCIITLEDTVGNKENIRCDFRTGDIFGSVAYPLQRGYGGTVARNWASGVVVEIRWNKQAIAAMQADAIASADLVVAAHVAQNDPHTQYATKTLAATATMFYPHAAAVPNMTVMVDHGSLMITGSPISKAQQTTAVISVPGSNSRIDRVVIDSVTGDISVVAGTPAVSPAAPAIPPGKLPCCQFGPILPSTTAITNAMITDERTVLFGVMLGDLIKQTTAVTTSGAAPNLAFTSVLGSSVPYAARQRHRITFNASGGTMLARDTLANVNIKQYDSTGAKVTFSSVSGLSFDIEHDGTDYVVLNPLPTFPIGSVIKFAGNTAPVGFLKANGAAVSIATYASLYAFLVTSAGFTSQSFTVNIATPAVFTKTAHGFSGGERLRLSTTGSLPTGLSTTADYFVEVINANTFYLNTTQILGSSRVATSGTQSGTHNFLQSWFGLGDGTTTFNLPDLRGEFIRGWDDGRGVDTGRSFGSWQVDMFKSHNHNQQDGLINTVAGSSAFGLSSVNGSPALVTSNTGGIETRPRNVALLACIKY